jgi:CheY-like chemotaxis protein
MGKEWGCALHWMIVEDEADIRMLVTTMAQVWGHSTTAYESGGKAWDWLDTVENGSNTHPLPEFALMDIRMPGKRGDEVAARIRETTALKEIPIVLMTAFVLTDEERKEMMKTSGVDAIINKPLPDFMQLKDLLHGVIDKKKQGKTS